MRAGTHRSGGRAFGAFGISFAVLSLAGCNRVPQTSSVPISYTDKGDPYVQAQNGEQIRLLRADEPAAPPGLPVPEIERFAGVPRRILPARVDLSGNQTAIRNQGGRDTCTVFSMVAGLEAAYKRLYGLTLDLSEQYLNHVQKATWENGSAVLPAAEIQPETNGGGNLTWHSVVLERYGIPPESQLPYIGSGNYQNTNQAGDVPSGLDSATIAQRQLDDFNLSETLQTYSIPQQIQHAVLPQSALTTARYRPTLIVGAPASSLSNLFWYKQQLASGREVMITFTVRGTVPNPLTGVWQAPPPCGTPCAPAPAHSLLIAGYDDATRAFMIKNSWGPGWTPQTFLGLMSYDWIEQGFVREAISIVDVADPNADFGVEQNAQLLMGRWNTRLDGVAGVMDVYRLPNPSAPLGDSRIGTYFEATGAAHRVNASIAGRRVNAAMNLTNPGQPVGGLQGSLFNAFVFSQSYRVLAGTYVDQRDNKTYPVVAWKDAKPTTVPTAGPLSLNSYTGRWSVVYDGVTGRLDVTSVRSTTRAIQATFIDAAGVSRPVSGTVQADTRHLTAQITFGPFAYAFDAWLSSGDTGLMAGAFTMPNAGQYGFYGRRTGPIPARPPTNSPPPDPQDRVCANKPYLPQCKP